MNKRVIDALKGLGIPVTFRKYTGNATTYITFFTYLDQDEEYADDEPIANAHYVQVDVWSKGNYEEIVNQAHELLKTNGLMKLSFFDDYDDRTETYHKVMRYKFKEEL